MNTLEKKEDLIKKKIRRMIDFIEGQTFTQIPQMTPQKTNYNKSQKLINRIKALSINIRNIHEFKLNENGNIDIISFGFNYYEIELIFPLLKRSNRVYFLREDKGKVIISINMTKLVREKKQL